MKSTLLGPAAIAIQAFLAQAAWASGNGGRAGGTAGLLTWAGNNPILAAAAGVAALVALIAGVAVFRTPKSGGSLESLEIAADDPKAEPH